MERKHVLKIVRQVIQVAAFGGIYLGVVLITGHGIPCIFQKLTGWKCPGCGMTRAMVEISRGNLAKAMQYNALSLTVLPVVCLYLLYRLIREEGNKKEGFSIWEYVVLAVLLMITLGYAYARNVNS